jgi:hypothetical protein
MTRQADRIKIPPLTPERAKRRRAALKRADQFRKALLVKRGGRLFEPVSDDSAATRKERERRLP